MTCIIIDDEPLARQGLQLLLQNLSAVTIKATFSNAIDAGTYLQKEMADIIFLDINMPELNGMDFVKSLLNRPLVIFVTAYPQYALDSYDLDAVDYLVKPVRLERLIKAVNKADLYLKVLNPGAENSLIESIEQDYVFIKADRKFTKVFFKDILYIEGLKDYVVIKMADKKIVTAMNIKTIAGQLPPLVTLPLLIVTMCTLITKKYLLAKVLRTIF
jgi:DNA-binding LytR/AlgR family response regulator